MRTLKFRVWSDDDGKYLDGMAIDNFVLRPNGNYHIDTKCGFVEFPVIIELYTGLKDKNGKEIYEGDIVRLLVSEDFRKKFLEEYHCEIPTGDCQVFFECGAFMINQNDEYYLPLGQYKTEEIEVIGNIHENKELLERSGE